MVSVHREIFVRFCIPNGNPPTFLQWGGRPVTPDYVV
jgi:hypothetical protein